MHLPREMPTAIIGASDASMPTGLIFYQTQIYAQTNAEVILNLTEFNWIATQVPIMMGAPDGTEQGSQWLIECPVVIIAHV